jgi:hypothetical protein
MKGWQVPDELEMISKETAVAYFKVLSRHLPGETEKYYEKPQLR